MLESLHESSASTSKADAGGDSRTLKKNEDLDDDGDCEWRLVVPKPSHSLPEKAGGETKSSDGTAAGSVAGRGGGEEESDGEWTSCSEPPPPTPPASPPPVSSSSNDDADLDPILVAARKAAVAASGTALVGLGLVMIPLPTPFGCAVAASGMAVLGTEFPAAQRVLDRTREGVVEGLEKMASLEDDDEESERKEKEAAAAVGGDAVLVRRPSPSGDGREDDDGPDDVDAAYRTSYELDDMAEEARRTFRRHASQFGKRVLPLLRPKEDEEKGVEVETKEVLEGGGEPIAVSTAGR